MVTGAHRYTSDLVRPGMLLRPRPASARALKRSSHPSMPRTRKRIADVVIVRDGDFVGAVASG